MSEPFRAVFFGTPAIAVPALEALHALARVVGVVCQPDKPAGRGLTLQAPPVKSRALALGLTVVQPEKIRTPDFARWLRDCHADVALVLAYGRILPRELLLVPRRGCVNLHASLLPKLRGAAPINWAIARGETETGISLMQMDEGCDTGPIYSLHRLAIGPDETAGELSDRLAALAAEVVRTELAAVVRGERTPTPQPAEGTLAPKLTREHGLVDWAEPAGRVHDRVRGMTPWPGAHTFVAGSGSGHGRLKLLATRLAASAGHEGSPGEIVAIGPAGARVACGAGSVLVLRAQLEGRKALGAVELASGRAIAVGLRLGSEDASG
ncbi:MAG: methionyl-tRNA formyltransferase [Polyangiaceae bacterium]|nr:methionyl-tRNA formyltransferase [Polyangiaceae bacterium]